MTKKQRTAIRKIARVRPAVGQIVLDKGSVITNGAVAVHVPQKFEIDDFPPVPYRKYIKPAKELFQSIYNDGDFYTVDCCNPDGKVDSQYIKLNQIENKKFGNIIKLESYQAKYSLIGYYSVKWLRIALAAVGSTATAYIGMTSTKGSQVFPLLYIIPAERFELGDGVRAVLFPLSK